MLLSSRIPPRPNKSFFAMNRWFNKMYQSGLLYHPDDAAENIVSVATGEPLFTKDECGELDKAMADMFEHHGDKVYEVGLHYAQKALGIKPDRVLT